MNTFETKLSTLKESNKLELKKASNTFPNEALLTYSAFANTDGGIIIFGIEETKEGLKVTGVENPEKVKKEMFDCLNNRERVSKNLITDDMVKEEILGDKTIILVEVPRANFREKPVYLKNNLHNSYKRNFEGDYKCTEEEVKSMVRDSSSDSLDSTIAENYTIEDLDFATIKSYRTRFSNLKPEHPFNTMENIDFLLKVRALTKDRKTGLLSPTLGGLLVFGKNETIKEQFPHYHLDYFDKSVVTEERWSERIVYDGTWEPNLYNFFFLVINRLHNSLPNKFEMKSNSIEREDYSELYIALREIFINSLIHADFKLEGDIKITRYPNYYQFENPGLLRISKEEFFLGHFSNPRNHIVQELFRLLNLWERAGTGIPKILSTVKKESYKYPDIEEKGNRFIFKFWNTSEIENADNLNNEEKEVLKFILKNKSINNGIARETFSLTKHTANNIFNSLIEKDYIEKVGAGKNTHYVLKYSDDRKKIKMIEDLHDLINEIKKTI